MGNPATKISCVYWKTFLISKKDPIRAELAFYEFAYSVFRKTAITCDGGFHGLACNPPPQADPAHKSKTMHSAAHPSPEDRLSLFQTVAPC